MAALTDDTSRRGAIRVFYRRTSDVSAAAIGTMLALLSDDERSRYDALGFAADKRDYVTAHALLRLTLGACLQMSPDRLRFGADDRGKPMLLLPAGKRAPSFSLSHARGLVTCAIASEGVVGVDAEPIDASFDTAVLARRFFAADEAETLDACSHDERTTRFFKLWTLKEALLKALGTGLGLPLNCVSFDPRRDGIRVTEHPPLRPREWTSAVMELHGSHMLAVAATPGRHRPVIVSESSSDPLGSSFDGAIRVLSLQTMD
jgi:4'-phosphopantetheinyl transferase